MTEVGENSNFGLKLKELLKKQSLSMRELSRLTAIDTATISRIINGKRKANLEHLQKFSDCLSVPITDLFVAAGYPIEQKQSDDIQSSIESIQNIIDSSHLYNKKFTIESVEQQLAEYEQFS
ncbi:MAG TPA: helix-turn-helix transcriptional regulator, partial [Neobacillus sp.]